MPVPEPLRSEERDAQREESPDGLPALEPGSVCSTQSPGLRGKGSGVQRGITYLVTGNCPHLTAWYPKVDVDEWTSLILGNRTKCSWAAKPGGLAPTKTESSHLRLPQCQLLTNWTSWPQTGSLPWAAAYQLQIQHPGWEADNLEAAPKAWSIINPVPPALWFTTCLSFF